ncbi:MAG: insulinase family protein, partial [Bacteroidales bacterium]|nr:insulinase family protein [Bacteroidales bacterium]
MKKNLSFALIVFLAWSAAWGQPVTAPGSPLQNDPSVRVGQLDNGLTYYIKQNLKPKKRAEFYLFIPMDTVEVQSGPTADNALWALREEIDNERPDVQAIIVVGDIDVDEIEQKIQTIFADIPKPEMPHPKASRAVPDHKEPLMSIATDSEALNTLVSMLYKQPPPLFETNHLGTAYILEMMKSMTAAMLNERLGEIAQRPDAPFLDASAGLSDLCLSGQGLTVEAVSKDGAGMTAFYALLQELERLHRFGFTESELSRAKTNMIRMLERKVDNASERTNSELAGAYIAHFRDNKPYMTPEYELRLAKGYMPFIRLSQMNELAKELMGDENIVITYNAPPKAGVAMPEEKDFIAALKSVKSIWLEAYTEKLSSAPLVDASTLKGGKIIREESGPFGSILWVLDNGVQVVLKSGDLKKDEVGFTAFKQGGTSILSTEDLPAAVVGLPAFLPVSGVSNFPFMELNKKLAGTIASVSPYIAAYEQGFQGTASPKDFETMLQLLYLRIAAPRFVESEFVPVMAQLHTVVPNMSRQPDYLLNKELYDLLYKGNPRRFIPSEEILAKIDFTAMEKVYHTLLGTADGMTIVMTGHIEPEKIKPLIELYIGSLPVRGGTPAWKDEGIY